jgi:hypothetical protein
MWGRVKDEPVKFLMAARERALATANVDSEKRYAEALASAGAFTVVPDLLSGDMGGVTRLTVSILTANSLSGRVTSLPVTYLKFRLSTYPYNCGLLILHDLAVSAYARECGLGSWLVNFAEYIASWGGYSMMESTTNGRNKSERTLRQCGHKTVGEFYNRNSGNTCRIWTKAIPERVQIPTYESVSTQMIAYKAKLTAEDIDSLKAAK